MCFLRLEWNGTYNKKRCSFTTDAWNSCLSFGCSKGIWLHVTSIIALNFPYSNSPIVILNYPKTLLIFPSASSNYYHAFMLALLFHIIKLESPENLLLLSIYVSCYLNYVVS